MDLTPSDTRQSIRKLAADFVDTAIIPHIQDRDRADPFDTTIIGQLGDPASST